MESVAEQAGRQNSYVYTLSASRSSVPTLMSSFAETTTPNSSQSPMSSTIDQFGTLELGQDEMHAGLIGSSNGSRYPRLEYVSLAELQLSSQTGSSGELLSSDNHHREDHESYPTNGERQRTILSGILGSSEGNLFSANQRSVYIPANFYSDVDNSVSGGEGSYQPLRNAALPRQDPWNPHQEDTVAFQYRVEGPEMPHGGEPSELQGGMVNSVV